MVSTCAINTPGQLQECNVEVFKTNVPDITAAKIALQRLAQQFPGHRINFDLHDCDRILRIEGAKISESLVIATMKQLNHYCETLE
jgi:hypothetical protein